MEATPGTATPVVIRAISLVTALMVAATSAQREAAAEVAVVVHASGVEALTIGPVTAPRKVAVMVAVMVVADPMSNVIAAGKWDTLQVPVPMLV